MRACVVVINKAELHLSLLIEPTMSYNTLDTKPRAHSPSEGNVVDHHAPHGNPTHIYPFSLSNFATFKVTDEVPAGPKRVDPKTTMIKVQPLKRSEMQVNFEPSICTIHIFIAIIAFLCSGSWNW